MTLAHRSVLIAAGFTLIVTVALARNYGSDPFDLAWHTLDGGGGESSGGDFKLAGTIGQHDANMPPVMTGGGPPGVGFELVGGFWPGIAPVADACPTDLVPPPSGNGLVDVDDLLFVINHWGPCPVPPTPCPADIAPTSGNGVVDVDDLLGVINAWGVCQ